MTAVIQLIKREWLEHKTGFVWVPTAVLATCILVTAFALTFANSSTAKISISSESSSFSSASDGISISLGDSDEDTNFVSFLLQDQLRDFLDYSEFSDVFLASSIDKARASVAAPFRLVFFLVAVFALLGSLHEDRRDRTVLFWKSMPVSDSETVLSKLVHVAWVAPVVTIAAILTYQIFLLLIVSVAGDGSLWRLWSNSGIIMEFVELTVGYFIQGLWALPIYGWLLLISSAVNRVPFVWAVLVPIAPAVIESALFSTSVIRDGIFNHLRFAALPSAGGTSDDGYTPAVHLGEQLGLLVSADLWIGIAIGAGFVAAAIYMRRRNNEI